MGAASVDHNKQNSVLKRLYCNTLQVALQFEIPTAKTPRYYNAQHPFIPSVTCTISLTVRDITVLHKYVNYSQS